MHPFYFYNKPLEMDLLITLLCENSVTQESSSLPHVLY